MCSDRDFWSHAFCRAMWAYDHGSNMTIIDVVYFSRGREVGSAGSCLLGNSDDCREGKYSPSANHAVAIKTQANVRGSGETPTGVWKEHD